MFLVVFLMLINSGYLFGQQIRVELGDKYFDQFAYEKAIRLYEEAIKMDKPDWRVFAKLGDCYYYTSRPLDAIKQYQKALINMPIYDYNDHFRLNYVLCLLSKFECENVIKQIDDNIKKEEDSERTLFVLAKYYNLKLESDKIPDNFASQICNSKTYTKSDIVLENLPSNSSNSDFGGFISNDIIYFASSRENPSKKRKDNKRLYKWNNQPFLDVYDSIIEGNNESLKLPDLSEINTIAHEASVTITSDGKTMYYASGNVSNNKMVYNNRGTSILKIKRAKLINNKWVNDSNLKDLDIINLENYSVGNPALSPDGNTLYFVTCAPYTDAHGKTDIYYVDLESGKIKKNSIPQNLKEVNTKGREMFPFISKDNILYFSSDGIYDGIPAMGLLDIYAYDLKAKGDEKNKVVSMRNPYNSKKDDFAYYERMITDSLYSKEGFFSSNRDFSELDLMGYKIVPKGGDDIYRFKEKNKCKRTIHGSITDLQGKYLENAMVKLIDSAGTERDSVKVNATGSYKFDVECDKLYHIRGSKELYYDDLKEFKSDKKSEGIKLYLKPFPCQIIVHHTYKFDTILGKGIHKDDLKPVLEFLIKNPNAKLRIESYTDSRGGYDFNLKLSVDRAEFSKSYLISAGVNENQIISVEGFGEDNLVISDVEIEKLDSSEKKDAAHKINRRSLFNIDYPNGFKDCQEINPNN